MAWYKQPTPALAALLFAAIFATAASQDMVTVVLTVPFGALGIPSPIILPTQLASSQATFKTALLKAFTTSLTNVPAGPNATAPAVTVPSYAPGALGNWTFDSSTSPATVVLMLEYDSTWLAAIDYLIAVPDSIFTSGGVAGASLLSLYGAIDGVVIAIVTLSPPPATPSTPTRPTTPSVGGNAPLSPPLAPPPSVPAVTNSTNVTTGGRLLLNAALFSAYLPTELANQTAFQNAYFAALSTVISNLSSSNVTFPTAPTTQTWLYTLVLANASLSTTPASPPRGAARRLMQATGNNTAAAGFTWEAQVAAVYSAVDDTLGALFLNQSDAISVAAAVIVSAALNIPSLTISAAPSFTPSAGASLPPSAPPSPPPYGGVPAKRRLVERQAIKAHPAALTAAQASGAEPSDVAYGTNKALFEIFATPTDYFAAGAACAARGARLASYDTEGSQIFIDILCDGVVDSQCWIEGNTHGLCSAVETSAVHQADCMHKMPFICVNNHAVLGDAMRTDTHA